MDFVFIPFKKNVIVKKCYGHCILHNFLNYTMIEKNDLEVELMRIKNLYWTIFFNTNLCELCCSMSIIRSEIRNLMNEHCDLLKQHMYFRRDIKRNQKIIKIFSKRYNICNDIQSLILDYLVEKPKIYNLT